MVHCRIMRSARIPRVPFRKEVYLSIGGGVLVTQSGEMGLKLANWYAPSSTATSGMLHLLRRKQKWSQATLAAILGVPKHTLRRWEEGTRNPSGAARRLIWMIWRSLTGQGLPSDLFDWVTWGRLPNGDGLKD